MLSLSSFLRTRSIIREETSPGTYCALYPDARSRDLLAVFASQFEGGTIQPSEKLHCTVLYSRKPVDIQDSDFELPYEGIGDEVSCFPQQDGKKCVVLKISSLRIPVLHHTLRRVYGATHDYPTYEPHVTLVYDYEGDVESRGNPFLPIVFDRHVIKPIDEKAH